MTGRDSSVAEEIPIVCGDGCGPILNYVRPVARAGNWFVVPSACAWAVIDGESGLRVGGRRSLRDALDLAADLGSVEASTDAEVILAARRIARPEALPPTRRLVARWVLHRARCRALLRQEGWAMEVRT